MASENGYQKSFNSGYLIAKFMPEMADALALSKGNGEKLQALKKGREQFLSEEFENRMPTWLKDDPFKNDISGKIQKNLDKEIDKDI